MELRTIINILFLQVYDLPLLHSLPVMNTAPHCRTNVLEVSDL